MRIQSLFETSEFQYLQFERAGELALYGIGVTSGVVCDIGELGCEVSSFYEGFGSNISSFRNEMGGRYMTNQLIDNLQK